MYNPAYLKIMYIQNDSQCQIHVLGAWEQIFNECISQNCESQPIVYNYFLILCDQTEFLSLHLLEFIKDW